MKFHRAKEAAFFLAMLAMSAPRAYGGAVAAPNLGTASAFGLLGGTVSNTGTSIVDGNVGAMTAITGFPPGIATGSVTLAGPAVTAAFEDFVTAYNSAFSDSDTPPTQTETGGLTTSQAFIGNNVYSFSSASVTSTAGVILTFDAQGNSGDVFILKDIDDLTINGPIVFNLIDGALAANIYWIVGDTAMIDPVALPVTFDGSILAGASFTMSANTGGSGMLAGTINGCVYAESGTATLAGETDITGCTGAGAVPEPGSAGLLALGCLFCVFCRCRLLSAKPAQRVRPAAGTDHIWLSGDESSMIGPPR